MGRAEIKSPVNWPRKHGSTPPQGGTNVGIKSTPASQISKDSNPVKDSLIKLAAPLRIGRDSSSKSEETVRSPKADKKIPSEETASSRNESAIEKTPYGRSGRPEQPKTNFSPNGYQKTLSDTTPARSVRLDQPKTNNSSNGHQKTSNEATTAPSVHQEQIKTNASPNGYQKTLSEATSARTERPEQVKAIRTPYGAKPSGEASAAPSGNNEQVKAIQTPYGAKPSGVNPSNHLGRNGQSKATENHYGAKPLGEIPSARSGRSEQSKTTESPYGAKPSGEIPSAHSGRNGQSKATESPYGAKPSGEIPSAHSGRNEQSKATDSTSDAKASSEIPSVRSGRSELPKTNTAVHGQKAMAETHSIRSERSEQVKFNASSNVHKKTQNDTPATHSIMPATHNKTQSKASSTHSVRTESTHSILTEPSRAVSATPSSNSIRPMERRTSNNSMTSVSTISAVSASSKPDPDGEYGSKLRQQTSTQEEGSSALRSKLGSTEHFSAPAKPGTQYHMPTTHESTDSVSSSSAQSSDPDGEYGSKLRKQAPKEVDAVSSTVNHSLSSTVSSSAPAKDVTPNRVSTTQASALDSPKNTNQGPTRGATHTNEKPAVAMPAATVAGPQALTDIELALFYAQSLDSRDIEAIKALAHPDCDTHFAEIKMKMTDFLNEMSRAFDAFPDMNFVWKDIKTLEPGVVQIGFFQVSGTHTGEPWGFEPYPLVPAEGRKFKTDPEAIIFETEGGKFSKINYIATSDQAGLPGIYRQIGGFPI